MAGQQSSNSSDRATMIVSTVAAQKAATHHLADSNHVELVPGELALIINHAPQPLVIRGKQTLTLGRRNFRDRDSTIDLDEFHGQLLGVSRQHARLLNYADGVFLQDLDSTNGTWVNEERVQPGKRYLLHNGDQLRLGQLVLYVYFVAPVPAVRQTVMLYDIGRDTNGFRSGLTPAYISEELSGCLSAMAQIQDVINEMQGRPGAEMRVEWIATDNDSQSISMQVTGMREVIAFLLDKLTPWKKDQVDKTVARLIAVNQLAFLKYSTRPEDTGTGALHSIQVPRGTHAFTEGFEILRRHRVKRFQIELEVLTEALVTPILQVYGRHHPEQAQAIYAQRLLPPVYVLLLCGIMLTGASLTDRG